MIITINGQEIEILTINVQQKLVDWRRMQGYTGACVTPIVFDTLDQIQYAIESAIYNELGD